MRRQTDECRAWLESYGELRAEADRLWNKHRRLRDQATKITSRLSLVPGGGGGDKEKLLASLADASGEAVRMEQEALDRAEEIERFIESLPTPESRIILRLRYLERLKWTDLSRKISRLGFVYSENHIYKLHGRALNEARAMWKGGGHG